MDKKRQRLKRKDFKFRKYLSRIIKYFTLQILQNNLND